jgi:hypothetical protein
MLQRSRPKPPNGRLIVSEKNSIIKKLHLDYYNLKSLFIGFKLLPGYTIKAWYVLILFICIAGCASKPNQQELNRLEDARQAAEMAEQQLEKLRKERVTLEEELARQKQLLDSKQKEANEAEKNFSN